MSEKEIEILDKILDKLCEDGNYVDAYSFQEYPTGIIFGYEDNEEAKEYFVNLAIEFEDAGIGTINKDNLLKPIGKKHIKFKNNGGFKKYFKDIEKEKELQKQDNLKQIEREERIEKIEGFQLDEFEYKKNIREQNDKIRKLELKIKRINILKEYGWILGVFIIVVEILIELGKMLFS
jgi:hypothetical protein|tara:strand:- start:452 stop:985 length:534 start_codon:yes stop_codon:yes gene_type:complete